MMTREELEAAFHAMQHDPATGRPAVLVGWNAEVVTRALYKQLALMPEKCGTCGGSKSNRLRPGEIICPTCHGSGKVYPPETVRIISMEFAAALAPLRPDMLASLFVELCNNHAVAILDALGETE